MVFTDRHQAGRALAEKLLHLKGTDPLVLALPRGGVECAAEIAAALDAPLDVLIVRKLGLPGQEELAVGAIASGGGVVMNPEIAQRVPEQKIKQIIATESAELARREQRYRADLPPLNLRGRTIVLVDDGAATGASFLVALRLVHSCAPVRVVAAIPVASKEALEEIAARADITICLTAPEPFGGVGMWYHNFSQVSDETVEHLLADARARVHASQTPAQAP